MSFPLPRPGQPVADLETPALVIDADALERNLSKMADFARSRRVRLRPHAKTHKCAKLARLQMEAGAVGVCVQKVSEAEALAAAGVPDIYISNEVIDPRKLERVADLAGRITIGIAVDSALGVQRLADALNASGSSANVFVEIDVGHGRCGVAPIAASTLAHHVISAGLRFAGLQAYHGRAQHLRSPSEREATIRHAVRLARAAQASISAAGIVCPLVTGGGTGTFFHEADSGLYGELQTGSYVFMDRDYADNEPSPGAPRFEHALFVKAQVMSRGVSHAVIDAGHKSHAIDSGLPAVWTPGNGRRVEGTAGLMHLDARDAPAAVDADGGRPGWRTDLLEYANGGDEHGILRPRGEAGAGVLPALGEAVWLVPGHCDPTVNLHERYVVVRGGLQRGVVEAVWAIEARGCMQ
jgi:D-serine deaminase-like pyridoxal phosphate-dependent protein